MTHGTPPARSYPRAIDHQQPTFDRTANDIHVDREDGRELSRFALRRHGSVSLREMRIGMILVITAAGVYMSTLPMTNQGRKRASRVVWRMSVCGLKAGV